VSQVHDGLEELTPEQRNAIEAFEAGEDIGTGERVAMEVRRPLSKVVPIRMSEDQWELLAHEAQELGTRPTTLLRIWVMERLREAGRARTAPDPAATDVGELMAALKASVEAMQAKTVRRRRAG